MSFSNDIKMIRQRCLLSQQDFAEVLGVSFATVNRWEAGRSKPTYKTMKLIDDYCKKHNIDFDISQELVEMNGELK
jgi:DNA-binding transcriptional regulator YiaG